jgi:hypothetical protein
MVCEGNRDTQSPGCKAEWLGEGCWQAWEGSPGRIPVSVARALGVGIIFRVSFCIIGCLKTFKSSNKRYYREPTELCQVFFQSFLLLVNKG